MRVLLRAAMVSGLLLAGPVLGEEPAPTPEAVAAARAETDRLVTQAGAQAFFVNETDDDVTLMARHRPSGMGCRFVKTQTNAIILDAAPAGEAVTCRSYDTRYKVTVSVSARPLVGQYKDAYKAFAAADKAAHPRGMLPPRLTRNMMDDKQRAILKRALDRWSRDDAGDLHRAGMIVIDGKWVLTLDATAPGDQVMVAEIVSDVVWLDAIIGALALAIDGEKTWTTPG